MPHLKTRLSATALVLLSGCATPNIFTASQSNKPSAEQTAANGPRPSQYTTSWSNKQGANRAGQDNAVPPGAGAAAADSERRIQDLLAAGERSQSNGDRRSARSSYEQVLRVAPGDASANYQLAIMNDEDGRYAEAEMNYLNVLRQAPHDANVMSSLGWSYFLQGRYEDSDRILREALRYEPNNKFALNNLGMLYGTRGDYDGALTIFRMAGSEADAQKALALLKQNAGTVPVAGEQFANTPVNSAVQAGGSVPGGNASSRIDKSIEELEFKTPQQRKFAEDYKRLKAENDKREQEKRARLAQKNMSAPSPWNNKVPSSDAAFPGATPTQANRPRQASPAEFGPLDNAPAAAGNIPPFKPNAQSFPGTQTIYEQPAAPRPELQQRSPVITPTSDSPPSRGSNLPTWNSLPRDDSYRGNVAPPPGRMGDWPRNSPNPSGAADPSLGNNAGPSNVGPVNAGQFNAGQVNAGQPRGANSNQDLQAAAQMGLSAGSAGLGFPAADWPAAPNGQMPDSTNGSNPAAGGTFGDSQVSPGGQIPAGGQVPAGGQNPFNGPAPSNGQSNGQPLNGPGPAAGNGGATLPPWPGRPLSSGSVPQAVVPSAQAVVYGSTGASNLPNFYSPRPTVSPAR